MIQPAIQQIGRYKILSVIGQGGMGIVYRALDPNMAREVAIKMPHGDKELLAHFQREVQATASFQHKNIVTVHTVDDFEGCPYMVMEYLDGQSMAEAISSGRILHLTDKLSLTIQVCDGLQYAHELGVVHRDIKPANIYILKERLKDKDVVAKILDFGIARIGLDSTITRTGQVRGSMSYMSPEQINGRKIDTRTDVYSTGVMLYQFLTGEVPYKSSDPSATFLKILNDPVPSLGEYIKNYPPALDEILRRAMAKSVEERYQTAEEFGYDLSQLQETIKRGMTNEFLQQARTAASRNEWEFARQHLQEIIKLDRHHTQANELLQTVRQEIQKQQRSTQIQQLRSQAQIALSGLHYEEALECLEQACRLAPSDPDLISFRETIKDAAKRAKTLAEALSRGQAALFVGDLNEAEAAVQDALRCQQDHTEARALEELIKKELAERSRRQQVQVFVEQARQNISKSQFVTALESLQKAREIDPADSNIRELLMWASRGHEQEKRRSELDAITKNIGRMLASEDYSSASKACDAALRTYPEEPSLIKLKQLADRQNVLAERRRFVEEQSVKARVLSDSGSYEEAIQVLQSALQIYPGEDSLNALLEMTRTELDFRKREKLESEIVRDKETLQKPVNIQLERSAKEIKLFNESIREARSNSEISVLMERAGFISRIHAEDPGIQAVYREIVSFATESQEEINIACNKASSLDDAMRSCQDVAQLAIIDTQIKQIQARWQSEKQLRDIAERSSERLHLATEAKNAIQQELSHLERSIASARSLTQISLYVQQSKILSIEWANDRDVAQALEKLQSEANAITIQVETACAKIKSLTLQLLDAPSVKDSEKVLVSASNIAKKMGTFEEVQDLLEKADRRLVERKNDYQRIERGLQSLIQSAAIARSTAELELILARQRDLLGKYPQERFFDHRVTALEAALTSRRNELAVNKALEEAAEAESATGSIDVSEPTTFVLPQTNSTSSTRSRTTAALVSQPRHNISTLLFSGAALLLISAASAFIFYPRAIDVALTPKSAIIDIDGEPCRQPCTAHLKPGNHTVTASLPGYEDLHHDLSVSLLNNSSLSLALKTAPVLSALPTYTPPPSQNPTNTSAPTKDPSLVPKGVTVQPTTKVAATTVAPLPAAPTATSVPTTPATVIVAPPVAVLNVSSEKIQQGDAAMLTWDTKNATQVTIDGLGQVPSSGSRQVTPDRRTTYSLLAKGDSGSATISKTIDVLPKVIVPTAPQLDPDKVAIKAALNHYKDAYESESLDDMKQIWPNITKGQQANLKYSFNNFNAIRLHLAYKDEDIHIQGDQASLTCNQVYTYTEKGKKLPEVGSPATFKLKKRGASWTVESVQ